MYIDRSVFGLGEQLRPDEPPRPSWLELPWSDEPVIVEPGAVRILSNAQSHETTVELTLQDGPLWSPGPDLDQLGGWPYVSASGHVILATIDGPEMRMRINLRPDARYVLRVWRKGGDTSAARFEELMGKVYPITGLEEYRFLFTQAEGPRHQHIAHDGEVQNGCEDGTDLSAVIGAGGTERRRGTAESPCTLRPIAARNETHRSERNGLFDHSTRTP
ncbi:hypothetical protein A8W25_16770 [Streptomyces sp. ERV7]|uniref:hypothetical protein n=1 Tax=Streptomyces sp. ERV7 TaxID=1322334 RepID=UPI0007F5221E|nr:hypothetical protein [Streptomyces sp. ERV7]OAR24108.1 hypothetical protein A8W25_16770 [Streptomyces sp. ERV7]